MLRFNKEEITESTKTNERERDRDRKGQSLKKEEGESVESKGGAKEERKKDLHKVV